jgi:hypothetical protein
MTTTPTLAHVAIALACLVATASSQALEPAASGGFQSPANNAVLAPFDVVHARITTEGNVAVFHMAVTGRAGANKPAKTGKLAGSSVFSYVWPTSIDPSAVGFEAKSGILALAVTSHPDFNDTPLWNDKPGDWHTHWVVLQTGDACGKGALKVVDIPEGAKPRLPKTWPGLPILLDSPGWVPRFQGATVDVRVPFDDIASVTAAGFDGVTAGLRVSASLHNPLLCVVNVFKVASGDLSLPGKPNQ